MYFLTISLRFYTTFCAVTFALLKDLKIVEIQQTLPPATTRTFASLRVPGALRFAQLFLLLPAAVLKQMQRYLDIMAGVFFKVLLPVAVLTQMKRSCDFWEFASWSFSGFKSRKCTLAKTWVLA